MKLKMLDFYCYAVADLRAALAYRFAWVLAVENRAPKLLRKSLRLLMRRAALQAVMTARAEKVRRAAA